MNYFVVLKSLHEASQWIVLSEETTKVNAEQRRKTWRSILGGKNWTINRRPNLDSLDHLGLTVLSEQELAWLKEKA